jgi:RNA polymerase sigma-70 factor, ECF subfamily
VYCWQRNAISKEPPVDLVLIRRCQAGDDEAFVLLFEQYKNLVYRTAYLTLGNATDAEDILQDVFIQVHRALDSYDPKRGAFTTWIYRITVNRCLNWRRSQRPHRSLKDAHEREAGDSESLHDRYADDDSVRRALDRLNSKLRVTVVLRYFCDLSYAEIAEILDVPLGTVKSRLNQAMHALHEDLKGDYPYQARPVTEVER